MPFSASPFLASSTFPFSFPSGRNPVLPFLKVVCYHSSSLFWFPEAFFSICAMRSRSRSFCFCFLFSSSVFFYRAVLVFLCLCAWRDLRLLMVPEDPCFLSLAVVLFFFWILLCLGFRILWAFLLFPHGSPVSTTLGLAWFFLLGLTYSFWAYFTMILFRPQQKDIWEI